MHTSKSAKLPTRICVCVCVCLRVSVSACVCVCLRVGTRAARDGAKRKDFVIVLQSYNFLYNWTVYRRVPFYFSRSDESSGVHSCSSVRSATLVIVGKPAQRSPKSNEYGMTNGASPLVDRTSA